MEKTTLFDDFLETQLNLDGGLKRKLDYTDDGEYRNIKDWITYGSEKEDAPFLRCFNHFHDPTFPWDSAGLDSHNWLWLDISGMSNLLWSQKPNQDEGVIAVGGDYSWPDVRDYYFKAFTEEQKSDREENLTNCFRGVGQLMHLLQDMGVPLHTRNDWHLPIIDTNEVETWAADEDTDNLKKAMGFDAIGPSSGIFTGYAPNNSAPSPVSALWDTNRYDGVQFPAGMGGLMGLAEFTNANFLTGNSMTNYTQPLEHALTLNFQRFTDPDGGTYLPSTTSDPGGPGIAHLALITEANLMFSNAEIFNDWRTGDGDIVNAAFRIDKKVMKDQACVVIPKAISYSGALADYFFRGRLSARSGIAGQGGYRIEIRNDSQEVMSGGTLTVGFLLGSEGETLNKVVQYDINGDINPGEWYEDLPTYTNDPEDLDNPFYIFYKGKLGDEEDAVIARVVDRLPLWQEKWSPSEGQVFTDGSGTIAGDLGIWRYERLDYGFQMTMAPCNSRIEILDGTLKVYECHHRADIAPNPDYIGQGGYRVWLDHFYHNQNRYPLGDIEWNCTPASENLGVDGNSHCWVGLLDGGLQEGDPISEEDDLLCLRSPEAGGSLYFGASVMNFAVNAEVNESTVSISGLSITATAGTPVYPPADAAEVKETWRGVTGTYKPQFVQGFPGGMEIRETRVPGDFGDWIFFTFGYAMSLAPCDTRVELENGVATVHECHQRYATLEQPPDNFAGSGTWLLILDDANGDLTKTYYSKFAGTAVIEDLTGDDDAANIESSWRLTEDGAWKDKQLKAGLNSFEHNFMPPGDLKLGEKVIDSPPFYYTFDYLIKLGLYCGVIDEAEHSTTTKINHITLTPYKPEDGDVPLPPPAPVPSAAPELQVQASPRPADPAKVAQGLLREEEAWATYDMVNYRDL